MEDWPSLKCGLKERQALRRMQTDKMENAHNYITLYRRLFERFKDKPITILEIGVENGESMELWKQELPNATIVGIDCNSKCKQYHGGRVHICLGNQSDGDFLRSVGKQFGGFDIIIDDGSHRPEHQKISFEALFNEWLHDDGLYIVEDMLTQYREQWCKNLADSFIRWSMNLIDCVFVRGKSGWSDIRNDKRVHEHLTYREQHIKSILYEGGLLVIHKKDKLL